MPCLGTLASRGVAGTVEEIVTMEEKKYKCPRCDGDGWYFTDDRKKAHCQLCDGSGRVEERDLDPNYDDWVPDWGYQDG